ncbi:MAG: bifunctional (p)ppGpp synthetase/guanosine-3',5'-bis(diphosphate) 3'-pyrophosphohydrolase [Candidatus Eisenbacteria bacterium]|uniref:Bifunctional (P)ppGpp synthetase/guanosine-3',5'-bis(Diphosphate) 3'-pyrophosphohydrolase n=1 Tax=Eiseniibacteriota bacterium TaxID=2212470 RepID=A0A956M047_UNCEI|nr:bifunctional (p)ppGpp synthetase/guanosine-3',5'-bis(diphosphate) 3'-pyrophosphohydrolase [Candidatus Eisenbacteria bacterium]
MSSTMGILENLESEFRRSLEHNLNPAAVEEVWRALEFARRAHDGQIRRSGEPYVTHPISVATILLDLLGRNVDAGILQAALLHDAIEDNDAIDFKSVAREFGEDVAHLVDGVTKIGGIPFRNREAEQSENFRKMLLSMARDIRVILIKLADRLHNMRTLDAMKVERRREIARETQEIYAPLAHRLGIAKFKWELEDLAFKHLEPEDYRRISELVATKREVRESAIDEIKGPLVQRLTAEGVSAEVTGRAKSFFSIRQKLDRSPGGFNQIFDLLGVRVLTESRGDCYRVLGVVHDLFVPVQDRFKDYIATPKSNMYQSLHTTVVGPNHRMVEIQIRTKQMHRTAELGIAAHYRYKEGGRHDVELDTKLGEMLVQRTTEWHEDAEDPAEFMDFLKTSLYQDEVFIFTPRGELKQLPRGATAIDFAYMVHTAVGHHCVGARVNGRLVALRQPLRSGDTVEILTSPSATPSEGWLAHAVTNRARGKIRHWIKTQRLTESIALGREMLLRELKKRRKKMPEEPDLLEVAQSFGLSDVPLLYAKLGEQILSVQNVTHRIYPELSAPKTKTAVDRLRSLTQAPVRGVRIQDISSLLIRMAQCCHPVPGDAVVGVITRGRGVSVHLQDCPNVLNGQIEPDRLMDLTWDVDRDKLFLVRLQVYGSDRENMLADVARAISKTRTNIKQGFMDSEDSHAVGDFLLEVRNLAHLGKVMRAIKGVKGVTRVDRKQVTDEETGEETA